MAAAIGAYLWLDRPRLDCDYSNLRYRRDSFELDFTLWIRADMTKEEFVKHATANHLTRLEGSAVRGDLEVLWTNSDRSWWNPPEEFELVYYSIETPHSDTCVAAFSSG